jgi:hypothetical protein
MQCMGRAWYSSLLRELFRLLALPAPWHVLRATRWRRFNMRHAPPRQYSSYGGTSDAQGAGLIKRACQTFQACLSLCP